MQIQVKHFTGGEETVFLAGPGIAFVRLCQDNGGEEWGGIIEKAVGGKVEVPKLTHLFFGRALLSRFAREDGGIGKELSQGIRFPLRAWKRRDSSAAGFQ